MMVFHWNLSDSKSPQVSRTRLRILAVRCNAVIWIVYTRPPTSKSSTPFNNPLVIVPKAPITIGTIVTFMLYSFFNSLARLRYSSFFSHSFRFILWSTRTAKSTILQILFFFFLLIIIRSGLLAGIRWSVCIIIIIIYTISNFSNQPMVSHWSLSDSKSPQASRTLISILTDLNNAEVWMVSTRPVISMFSTPCTYPFLTTKGNNYS